MSVRPLSEITECPVCGGVSLSKIRYSPLDVLRCRGCALVMTPPPASDSLSSGAHSAPTDDAYTERMIAADVKRLESARRTALARYAYFEDRIGRPLKVLEVGCGAGLFGVGYQERAQLYRGIDIDPRVVASAQSKGLDAKHVDLFEFDHDEPFDLITASQVVEHVVEPRAFVDKVLSLLSDDGIFHFDVPNHRSLAGAPSRLVPFAFRSRYGGIERPHHCFSYGSQSASALLGSFETCKVWSTTSLDAIWGQGIAPSGMHRAYFSLANSLGPNLIVGVASKNRSTA